MARPSKGWQLRRRPGRPWSVRFTLAGAELELGLGTHDEAEARIRAADRYADAVRGRRVPRRAPARGASLTEVAARWLTALVPVLDDETRSTYALYAETHWARRWAVLGAVTEASVATYSRERLGSVQASTVRKELSALRSFLAWCAEQGELEPVAVPSIPKRAIGTVHRLARKAGAPLELSPAEVRALLRALPVRDRAGYPVRARYVVAYETGLRPSTLDALSVPEHWRPGSKTLHVTAELDKARDGRLLPLTPAAVRALTSAAPSSGVLFGRFDGRASLRAAAVSALGEERGRRFSQYDLRRAAITHWAERSDNLPGIQYLAGHKHASTTSRYMRPSLRAAQAVLGARRR